MDVGGGVYRVEVDGRLQTVYVAGPPDDRWAFWDGRVFRGNFEVHRPRGPRQHPQGNRQTITSPMPATVVAIPVKPGDAVKRGDVVIALEAMKMELPIRAPDDAKVAAIHCREGELVQADAVLLELE
jgi:biotin carboxyl carrier protein